jgi:hypothetical protein
LKALSLGLADHIHELANFEHRESNVGALGRRFTPDKAKLANEFFGGRRGLCEMAGLRLADALGLLILKADLYRAVAILFRVFDLKDAIPGGFDDRGGCEAPFLIVEAGHAEFLA